MNLPATLEEQVKFFSRASRSLNTRKAYASDGRIFGAWCVARGLRAFPAAPSTLAAFVADQAQTVSVSTLARRIAAIARIHKAKRWPTPIDDSVREVLAGARRELGATPQPRAPLIADDLRRILDRIDSSNKLLDIRDRALLLVGWFGALRRSELVGLCVEHIAPVAQGLVLTVPKSKTDQEAHGQEIGLLRGVSGSLDACSALDAWMIRASIVSGPVFRRVRGEIVGETALSDYAVALIVKRRATLAGLDSSKLSGHSLRSGALTSGALSGASTWKLRELSRHKNLASLSRYVHAVELFQDHALSRV